MAKHYTKKEFARRGRGYKPLTCTVTCVCNGVEKTFEAEYLPNNIGGHVQLLDKGEGRLPHTCTVCVPSGSGGTNDLILKPAGRGYCAVYAAKTPKPQRYPLTHGIASIFDFAGLYDEAKRSASPEEKDASALAEDWGVVGHDIASALVAYDRSKHK
jgi:hypothetical protein